MSSPTTSYSDECPNLIFERHPLAAPEMPKMAKDSGGFVKSKAKGTVNFPPFENLDEASIRETKKYRIYPFGKIQEYCRHIPYNSGKKDFYEKTGRESFEVFQYIFKIPGDESEYTVMWDYNVGLVRMTPFFKCCKYSKTMPAKMLNMNPGLRDITHSITGGSIMAQAVCATFCATIAGALIPIFGPDFPSQCVPIGTPEHGRMVINPLIVSESAREAEMYRRIFLNANAVASNSHLQHHHHQHIQHYSHGPPLPSPTSIPSPRLARRVLHGPGSPYDYDRERVDFDGRMRIESGLESPYGVNPDSATHSGPDTPPLHHALHRSMPYSSMSPPRSSGWTVANYTPHSHSQSASSSSHHHGFREEVQYPCGPHPLLSAIPRFGRHARLDHYQTSHRLPPISQTSASAAWNASKRPAPEVDADYEYDGQSESSPTTTITTTTTATTSTSRTSVEGQNHEEEGPSQDSGPTAVTSGAEKKAALLLLNLSVGDAREAWAKNGRQDERGGGEQGCHPRGCGPESLSMSMSPISAAAGGHRSKRRRATSM
ncbi:hypothetical protein SLS53_000644 [Cytospora paraplurivora]|uniref:Uncharacterized protein n=1 Tax=Cytospora paraplurivora TaxID=2898453 RepID=A0AAN9YKJ6_9PEZI